MGENWELEDLQISSIDILEESAWEELRDKVKEDIEKSLPTEVVKLNYREDAIKEYIRAKIRKQIYKATDIKAVTFIHFYKRHQEAK